MLYGYARVSTVQQDTALQRAAFARAGVSRVVEEKRSGGAARPLLEALLGRVKAGDVVVVYKIDRLARSLADLLRVIERIAAAGASFRSLTEPIDTSTPAGRMVVQMLGVIAEFERAIILERCNAGRAAAKDRGVVFGRPVRHSKEAVQALRDKGLTHREIGERLGYREDTVSKVLAGDRLSDRRRAGARSL